MLARAQALLDHPDLLAHDVRRERAFLLIQLARVARDRGDHASDLTFWRESLHLSEELDDFEWVTYKTAGLGWLALRSSNYEEAHRHFVRARDQWQEQGNTLYLSNSLAGLGTVALHRGDLAEGEMLLREGMAAVIRTHGRLDKLVNLHQLLAETLLYSGQFAEARAIIDEGIGVYSAAARVDAANDLRHTRALLLSHMGEYDEAYLQAEAVYVQRELHPGKAAATAAVLGQITLAQKKYRASEEWLGKSLHLYTQIGQHARHGLPLMLMAIVQQIIGNSATAISSLQRARDLLVIERSVPSLLTFFPSAAWLIAQQGRVELALDCYSSATRYQFVTESRWIADVMEAPLKATARLQVGTVVTQPTRIQQQPLWTEAEQLSLIE